MEIFIRGTEEGKTPAYRRCGCNEMCRNKKKDTGKTMRGGKKCVREKSDVRRNADEERHEREKLGSSTGFERDKWFYGVREADDGMCRKYLVGKTEKRPKRLKKKKYCHGRNITAPNFISLEFEIKLTLKHLYLVNHLLLRDEPNTTG